MQLCLDGSALCARPGSLWAGREPLSNRGRRAYTCSQFLTPRWSVRMAKPSTFAELALWP